MGRGVSGLTWRGSDLPERNLPQEEVPLMGEIASLPIERICQKPSRTFLFATGMVFPKSLNSCWFDHFGKWPVCDVLCSSL